MAVTGRDTGVADVPCPSCGVPLPRGGAAQCPSCGIALTGPHATRLWELDQQLASLGRERVEVLNRLRAQPPVAAPAPVAAPVPAVPAPALPSPAPAPMGPPPGFPPQQPQPAPTSWPTQPAYQPPAHQPPTQPPPNQPPTQPPWNPPPRGARPRAITAQRLLLVAGVVLVLVAAVVFLTVSWRRIGVGGQVGVMALLTALAVASTLLASRRGLRSSAEALSVLAGGLLIVDLAAARALGMAGLDAVSGRAYTGFTGVLAAVLLAALHVSDRRVKGFAVLSMTALSIGAAGFGAYAGSPAAAAWVALATAVVFGLMATFLPERAGWLRTAAGGPGALWLLLSTLTASVVALDRPTFGITGPSGFDALGESAAELGCCGLLAVIAVGGVLVVRRVVHQQRRLLADHPEGTQSVGQTWLRAPHRSPWRALTVVAVASTLAAIVAVVGSGIQLGDLAAAVLAGLLVVPVALVVQDDRVLSPGRRWALTTTAVAQVLLVPVAAPDRGPVGATVLALAASAAVAAVARAGSRVLLAPAAAGLGLLGTGILVAPFGRAALVVALLAWSVATAAAAGWRRTHAEEYGLGAVALLGFLSAVLAASAPWERPLLAATTLALLGLTSAAYAALPGRRPVVTLAVVGLSTALWVTLADFDVSQPEAYVLPVAALVLGASWWWLREHSGAWQVATPALWVAVLPLALRGVDDDSILRSLVLLAVAVLVLAVGVHRSLVGWVLLGVVVEVLTLATGGRDQVLLGIALAAAAVSAIHTAVARPGPRTVLAPLATALAAGSAAALLEPVGSLAVAIGTSVVGLVALAVAAWRRDHAEELPLGGVAVLVVAAGATSALGPPGRPWLTAVVLGVLAVATLAYALLPRRRAVVGVSVAAATAALWVVLDDLGVDPVTAVEAWSLPPAVILLAAGLWVRRPSWPGWLPAFPALVVALLPSAVVALDLVRPSSTDVGNLVRPLIVAVAATALVVVGAHLRRRPWWALGFGVLVLMLLGSLASQPVAGVVLLLLAVGTAALARVERPLRRVAVPLCAALTAAGSGVLAELAGQPWLTLVLVVVAAAAVALAARLLGRAEEAFTAAVGVVTLLIATWTALDPWTDTTSSVALGIVALTVLGALASAYAGLPGRRLVGPTAVPAFTAAIWIGLGESGVETLEAYTLPLAVLLLLAGLLVRRPTWSSWFFLGPAVLVALVPSAILSLTDPGTVRPLLTVVGGAVALVGGVALRWQSAVFTGGVVTVVVGLSQLLPFYSLLPRWVTLAVVGILLLTLGIRYESTAQGARRTVRWMGDLG